MEFVTRVAGVLRRGLVVAWEEEPAVTVRRSGILRFRTPTNSFTLPSEVRSFLSAKKVTAAQLTDNRTTGGSASTDRAALRDRFEWFRKFFLRLSGLPGSKGLSCIVEEQRRAALRLLRSFKL